NRDLIATYGPAGDSDSACWGRAALDALDRDAFYGAGGGLLELLLHPLAISDADRNVLILPRNLLSYSGAFVRDVVQRPQDFVERREQRRKPVGGSRDLLKLYLSVWWYAAHVHWPL